MPGLHRQHRAFAMSAQDLQNNSVVTQLHTPNISDDQRKQLAQFMVSEMSEELDVQVLAQLLAPNFGQTVEATEQIFLKFFKHSTHLGALDAFPAGSPHHYRGKVKCRTRKVNPDGSPQLFGKIGVTFRGLNRFMGNLPHAWRNEWLELIHRMFQLIQKCWFQRVGDVWAVRTFVPTRQRIY